MGKISLPMKTKTSSLFVTAIAVPAAAIALSLTSCTTLEPTAAEIDADAKAVLQKTSDTLAAAKSFSFRVQRDVPAEIAEASGMSPKADIRVSARRPNRVMAERADGARFYYDGSTITRIATKENTYATADAPDTIDAMIDFLASEWGMRPPLAGLLRSNPFQSALEKAHGGKLLGNEAIDGVPCDHIMIHGEGVIWDLWISTEDFLPRKFDVTVTEIKGSPRGVTTMSEWKLDASFSDEHFKAVVPTGATRRNMEEMH
jgi:hypothetical protein